MLIGNYYAPKEPTTTTPEAQPLPKGPTTGPQNTGTQAVVSPRGVHGVLYHACMYVLNLESVRMDFT